MQWVVRVAIIGAIYSAGILLWLLLPGDQPVPAPVWLVAFVGLFPVFGLAVIFIRRYLRVGLHIWMRVLRRPGALAITAITVLVGLVVFARTSEPAMVWPGQPRIMDGHYVVNKHGQLTPVTRQEYLRATEAGQRNFVLIGLAFYVSALVLVETGKRLRHHRRAAR